MTRNRVNRMESKSETKGEGNARQNNTRNDGEPFQRRHDVRCSRITPARQYNTMQCNAMQWNRIQYNTIQYSAMQFNTGLFVMQK